MFYIQLISLSLCVASQCEDQFFPQLHHTALVQAVGPHEQQDAVVQS